MWTRWDSVAVDADLRRIAGLHANTVRAIVPAEVFGYPQVDDVYLTRLREFIDLAAKNGLHVQISLFDWWYRYSDVTGSEAWTREVLQPYARDPRIAFVELRNEIAVNAATLAWARSMIPFIRQLMARRTPVSLSVGGKRPLPDLVQLKRGLRRSQPDFYDIHVFGGGGEHAASIVARAKAIVAPRRVWIGETGYSTGTSVTGFGGVPLTTSAQEAAQTQFLRTVAWAARANSLPLPGIWTFTDFLSTSSPPGAVERPAIEEHFGLYRVDGTPKPAAATVAAAFGKGVPLSFNNGFERSVEDDLGRSVPAIWSMQGDSGVVFTSASTSHSGRQSARLTSGTTATGSYAVTPPKGVGAAGPATTVKATAWARRIKPSSKVFVVIEWMSADDRVVSRSTSQPLRAVGSWQRLTVRTTVPRGVVYGRLELVAQHFSGSVWFDDVTWA
jgi:hypothetical protein